MTTLLKRAAVVAAFAFVPLTLTTSAHGAAPAPRAVACPSGYVCIYPDASWTGQPYVRRASDGSVSALPSQIRDRGTSIKNNSTRTARVYQNSGYSGRWVCVGRNGGSIRDLRSYNLNDQTRSLRINTDACG